ncbi:P-loop containing nucleoside triphosphate hydrolase protein [Punctularia strigosozonata HHB-11173 SS5]|uniref:P-loop containing nucleoside triphosphate hydrolase protein n=1 Tax=Punctularia strigosozonata (strain HHB-11173) TaxID=741275 RepID=UPI0004416BA1|nr:P-loop containing nucleoside triphosphate hydrolase protein [Punctularia strigosozonata HHB-11173 SS5]EIN06700.1 P-loop containing nucleoside triphosphate hydrolase protein [Punctularia strigosozonata HHB-11173 SS5]
MSANLLGDLVHRMQPNALERVSQALDAHINSKTRKEDALLDILLAAFQESEIERHRAFELVDAAEAERKARRRADVEKKAKERAAKKAGKAQPSDRLAATPSSGKASPRMVEEVTQNVSPSAAEAISQTSVSIVPPIVVTTQQSRFHTETIITASKEIDLKGLNLAVGKLELLEDALLRLKEGVKYGLVGRNGTGKSTLLYALGEGLIPGLPPTLKIILVSQTAGVERYDLETNPGYGAQDALHFVLDSDHERKQVAEDFAMLSKIMESDNPSPQEVHKAVSSIYVARKRAELEDAQRIASKRSGARGADARKRLLVVEAELAAEEKRANMTDGDGIYTLVDAAHLVAELSAALDLMEAATAESRARTVLQGLGFQQDQFSRPVSSFSGGWRSRLALASALLRRADVLLLDEPVNYLDIPGVLWLERFVLDLPATVVIVSHDRAFCDAISEELIIIREKKLRYFEGNLSSYELQEWKKYKKTSKQLEALDKKKAHIQKTIEEGLRSAKKNGDDNRLRMVKSRQRKLDERWGLERNAAGHRFKLNRDFGGYHETNRAMPTLEGPEKAIEWYFPDPEPLRFPGALVHLESVCFQYSGAKAPTLSDIRLTIDIGDRVALVGPNGHGKTTLINLVTGVTKPTAGSATFHPQARIGHYTQHAVEQLAQVQTSALKHFIEYTSAAESDARAILGMLGLTARTADAQPVCALSGGQRVRLALAKVIWTAPDLLVLDEVTTHLDVDSIAALIDALRAYGGAILLASHDRHAVRTIVEGAPLPQDDEDNPQSNETGEDAGASAPGKTYVMLHGKLKLLERGVEEYAELVELSVGT